MIKWSQHGCLIFWTGFLRMVMVCMCRLARRLLEVKRYALLRLKLSLLPYLASYSLLYKRRHSGFSYSCIWLLAVRRLLRQGSQKTVYYMTTTTTTTRFSVLRPIERRKKLQNKAESWSNLSLAKYVSEHAFSQTFRVDIRNTGVAIG